MKILLVTKEAFSHVRGGLPVAHALNGRGASVHGFFRAQGQPQGLERQLERAGVKVWRTRSGTAAGGAATRGSLPFEFPIEQGRARYALRNIDNQVELANELAPCIESLRPDVLMCSTEIIAGAIAAKKYGLPLVGVAPSPVRLFPRFANPYITPEAIAAVARLTAEQGLEGEYQNGGFYAGALNIINFPHFVIDYCATVRPLTSDELPGNVRVFPSWFGTDDEDTAISGQDWDLYFSFGSVLEPPRDLVARVCRAADALEARTLLSVGPLASDPELAATAPACCKLVAFAPQMSILGKRPIFVHHGGWNSVHEGMFAGSPMLIWDGRGTDFELNRALTESVGVGATIATSSTVEELTGSLGDAMKNRAWRERAEDISRRFPPSHHGAELAADEILRIGREAT